MNVEPCKTLTSAIIREMPSQPEDSAEWFKVFHRTAKELRDSMKAEGLEKTARAVSFIIRHHDLENIAPV